MTKTPTAEQLKALRHYAAQNGRTWKSKLLRDWACGRSEGELQQVRNSFGPSWLITFKLAELGAD